MENTFYVLVTAAKSVVVIGVYVAVLVWAYLRTHRLAVLVYLGWQAFVHLLYPFASQGLLLRLTAEAQGVSAVVGAQTVLAAVTDMISVALFVWLLVSLVLLVPETARDPRGPQPPIA